MVCSCAPTRSPSVLPSRDVVLTPIDDLYGACTLQPRKKKPFDRKSAQKFVLMPRSLQDPVLHTEGGSQFVLVPAGAGAGSGGAFDTSDTASYMGGSVRSKATGRFQDYDEVDDMVRWGW